MKLQSVELFLIEHLIWVINFFVFVGFLIAKPEMFSVGPLASIVYSVSYMAPIVLAEALCLISGNFDISVGAIAGFSATIGAMTLAVWTPWFPGYLAIVIPIGVGGLIGAINGIAIAKFKINPFLQTLAMNLFLFGAMTVVAGHTIYRLPESYLFAGGRMIGKLPVAVIIIFVTFIIFYFLTNRRPVFRHIYAVGSNPIAAENFGISTEKIIFITFLLSGLLCGFGGLLYTGYIGCVHMGMGSEVLLLAFAGAIIGGVAIAGGRGSITDIFGGVILLGIFEVGLSMVGVSAIYREISFASILFAAIYINAGRRKLRHRLMLE